MTADIVVFDNLADLKRLSNDEAFLHLEKRFQRERGRYLQRMLEKGTGDQETLGLKAVLNALEKTSPMALLENILKIEVRNQKISHPEMFKIRKK